MDIGADEFVAPVLPPTLTSIAPNSGAQGATVATTLSGTNLANASAVTMSGTGVSCTVISSTATSIAASCVIAADATAGARTVTATTPGGTSGTVGFTVTASTQTHVGALTGSSARNPFLSWTATVTITVHNASHVAVSGAVVSGAWNTLGSPTNSCTTNASGQCQFSRTFLNGQTPVTYTVQGISKAGTVYVPGSNHVTSVTVNR